MLKRMGKTPQLEDIVIAFVAVDRWLSTMDVYALISENRDDANTPTRRDVLKTLNRLRTRGKIDIAKNVDDGPVMWRLKE